MNNDQLRAMYNSYGTLTRPQSYGDDLYNDRENMMPSAGQELTQTGTDEAGNPVMAPAEAPEAPRQEQAPLNNLIDFARSRMEQSLDNGIDITAGAGVWAPVVECHTGRTGADAERTAADGERGPGCDPWHE